MDTRAQGLPITTIILAILGLVVLVILFAITTGRLSVFSGAVNECPGLCKVSDIPAGVPASSALMIGVGCDTSQEQPIAGNFIARGVRAENNKPIPCGSCCQSIF